MVKRCIYDVELRCYHNGHCGLFDCSTGNVTCCGCHPRPFGFMMSRKVIHVLGSIWNKHALRRGS